MNNRPLIRLLLLPLSALYAGIVLLRNKLYDWGVFSAVSFKIPVISVGNLSAGGTGKTPHIEYLVQHLRSGRRIATLSRGYKRQTKGFIIAGKHSNALQIGDEPMQLKTKFPDVTVAVGENRAAAIGQLLRQQPPPEAILLDDAFQHRKVNPLLSILLTDYHCLFTQDLPLPAGRLREPACGYRRADIIVVTKCPPQLTAQQQQAIKIQINPLPHQIVLFSHLSYGNPYLIANPARQTLLTRQTAVLLVCAIANTKPLLQYVQAHAGYTETLFFADHHYFTPANLQEVTKRFDNMQAEDKIILTTEKDAMRWLLLKTETQYHNLPIYCLPVNVVFFEPDAPLLAQKLEECLHNAP
ncbi:tetraacyldisaccharide 4'-kinase [Sphingobacteriales bacterium UPWRP_1]|nr:tetraacyldisaccharide 4'-kinase [Sphingobacteriales bacterium TSM_CSM]PSJ74251.1 tetraacyldisaccharide 4'-kinase [Sphingobacteriales bacterium UPWRP_1]